jgi:hypothetical protein
MGETDVIIGTSPIDGAPTAGKGRICRTPGCMIFFDPVWRVRLVNEPVDMTNMCPRCGADLSRNSFIRRANDEVLVSQKES